MIVETFVVSLVYLTVNMLRIDFRKYVKKETKYIKEKIS